MLSKNTPTDQVKDGPSPAVWELVQRERMQLQDPEADATCVDPCWQTAKCSDVLFELPVCPTWSDTWMLWASPFFGMYKYCISDIRPKLDGWFWTWSFYAVYTIQKPFASPISAELLELSGCHCQCCHWPKTATKCCSICSNQTQGARGYSAHFVLWGLLCTHKLKSLWVETLFHWILFALVVAKTLSVGPGSLN